MLGASCDPPFALSYKQQIITYETDSDYFCEWYIAAHGRAGASTPPQGHPSHSIQSAGGTRALLHHCCTPSSSKPASKRGAHESTTRGRSEATLVRPTNARAAAVTALGGGRTRALVVGERAGLWQRALNCVWHRFGKHLHDNVQPCDKAPCTTTCTRAWPKSAC